jgi:hypothetical protein
MLAGDAAHVPRPGRRTGPQHSACRTR